MVRRGREKQRTLLLLVIFVFNIKILGMAVKIVSRGLMIERISQQDLP
jgi:hypothetical protein